LKEKTLLIVKPDGVQKNLAGRVLARVEEAGFRILACRMQKLTWPEAAEFYAVHRERPFYKDLLEFMTEGPVVLAVLEREDAVNHLRSLIGDTDPGKAREGTIRRLWGSDKQRNLVHASDSPENAVKEVNFFFPESAITRLWGTAAAR